MKNSLTFGRKSTKFEDITMVVLFVIGLIFTAGSIAWLTIETKSYSMGIWLIVMVIFMSMFVLRVMFVLRTFFPIEISGKFVVFLRPIARRAVYDMTYIKGIRLYWRMLFFRYNGWPTLIPLRIEKKERLELVTAIELANKALASHPFPRR